MATRWGCVGAGLVSADFFTAIKDNLPPDEHEVCIEMMFKDPWSVKFIAKKIVSLKIKRKYSSDASLYKNSLSDSVCAKGKLSTIK